MYYRIGIVGPKPSIERTKRALHEQNLGASFELYPYEHARETGDIITRNRENVHGWVFTGPIPYLTAQAVLHEKEHAIYCPPTGASLYKAMLQAVYTLDSPVKDETNRELERRVRQIIEHSAAMHELSSTVEVIGGAIPIRCDMELAELAVREAEGIAGFTCAEVISDSAALGSEDASYMIRRVQEQGGKATYMIVGSELPAPHHHPEFDIDEAVLAPAVELLERLARSLD
ncbi:M20/M25/M40 family metallo-hydrolase [Paenibacillus pabuli]|nr:M20/M25/M40 family metallo-hydrolase [Paenibacillus pabuli]MEC0124493.1 hypothetical protein [Paenibacillus pabuli]